MIVRGTRLSLRYPTVEDAGDLFELGRDPDVTRFFSWGPYRKPAEAVSYVESLPAGRRSGTRLEFTIVGTDDRPMGITGWSELSARDRRAVVGTWLGRPHWGTGANAESKALVLALGFRHLGLERATALVNPENSRSLRALERLGFVQEGVLRQWHRHADGAKDCAVLRLMRAEFEAGPLGAVEVEVEGEPPAAWALIGAYSQRK